MKRSTSYVRKLLNEAGFLALVLLAWGLGFAIYTNRTLFPGVDGFMEGIGVEVAGLGATLLLLRWWWGERSDNNELLNTLREMSSKIERLEQKITMHQTHVDAASPNRASEIIPTQIE